MKTHVKADRPCARCGEPRCWVDGCCCDDCWVQAWKALPKDVRERMSHGGLNTEEIRWMRDFVKERA